jgi:hypothetical protein
MKTKLMNKLMLGLIPCVTFITTTNSQASSAKPRKGVKLVAPDHLKSPALDVSMQLLNLWGKQPESTQELYKYSFKFLESDKGATFANLADTGTFLDLCKKDGRELLGGPLLGSVTATGTQIWVRTTKPGDVSVVVTVDGVDKTFGPVQSTALSDLTAIVKVTDLIPNSSYAYKVLVNGKQVTIPQGSKKFGGDRHLMEIEFGGDRHLSSVGTVI